jgi:thioesterase domain-containing protein/acyl carrier protein
MEEGVKQEEELLVDGELFEELKRKWGKVERVERWLKRGEYDNELSRFRYDVVMRIGGGEKKEEVAEPEEWIEWEEGGRWKEKVREALGERGRGVREGARRGVGVCGIRDGRVAGWVEAVRVLQGGSGGEVKNAGELRARSGGIRGENPEEVMKLAEELEVELCWRKFGSEGEYEAIFNPEWVEAEVEEAEVEGKKERVGAGEKEEIGYRVYGNAPMRSMGDREFGRGLQERLKEELPEYMVPGVVMVVEKFPLTPNGKVDRKRFPAPEFHSGLNIPVTQSKEEAILCKLFAEVLGLESVGVEDNFFALGGHSLLAVTLVSRIRAEMGIRTAVDVLFGSPTVKQLVKHLATGSPKTPYERVLSLRSHGSLPPLFCFPPAGGIGWVYAALTSTIHPDRPIHCLQAAGIAEDSPFPSSIREIAEEYLTLVRKIQPGGPYNFIGWSFGGIVAHNAACLLQQSGESISLLGILDTQPVFQNGEIQVREEVQNIETNAAKIERRLNQYLELSRQNVNGEWPSSLGAPELERILKMLKQVTALVSTISDYDTFNGDALLFAANNGHEKCNAWSQYIRGQIQLHELNCAHLEITNPVYLGVIGQAIEKQLESFENFNRPLAVSSSRIGLP